jgi:hypothetical protein
MATLNPQPVDDKSKHTFLDYVLYPFSLSGIVMILIMAFARTFYYWLWSRPEVTNISLIEILNPVLVLAIIIHGYLYYYLFECVRDSSLGGRRAVGWRNIEMPAYNDLLRRFGLIVVCIVITAGLLWSSIWTGWPAGSTRGFFIIVVSSAVVLPMLFLSVTMTDDFTAFNPFRIIAAIIRLLIPYAGIVIIFCAIIFAMFRIMLLLPQNIFGSLLWHALFVYNCLALAHILGRFYYNYGEKLDWGV